MSIERFFSLGLQDAGRRFPPLREPAPGDERAAVNVLESSAVVRWLDRAIATWSVAFQFSLALAQLRRLQRAVAPADGRFLLGIALVVAPWVHAALIVFHERPAGWLWLMLPSLCFLVGLLMAGFAAAERGDAG